MASLISQTRIINNQTTKLSDLHRDIWFELFAYFYADELFYTFVHLLPDTDFILLNDTHLRLHIRIDDELSTAILSQIDPTQIISLTIEEREDNCQIDISRMIHLQSAVISGSNTDRWMEYLLTQMSSLREMRRISLALCYNDRGVYLLDLALRIPCLKQLRFKDISNWEIDYHPKRVIQTKNLALEKLSLDFYCQFEYMKTILSNLPHIRTLRLKLLRGNEDSTETINEFVFNHLKKIYLSVCDVSFDRLISWFQTMPNVERMIIDGYIWGTNVIGYFQSDKWYQLLTINNQEKIIQVNLDLREDYSNLSSDNIGVINYDDFKTMGLQLTSYTIKGVIQSENILH